MIRQISFLLVPLVFFASTFGIFEGQDAKIEDFPFMASYQIEYWEHMCGAIILAPKWLVTSAYCASRWSEEETQRILAGSTYLSHEEVENNQTINIDSFVSHPNYLWKPLDPYDLALVKLVKPLVFGDTLKAATIASPEIVLKDNVTFVGWGETNFTNWKRSSVLQSISLPTLSMKDCEAGFGDDSPGTLDSGDFYCTGPVGDPEIGPCFKDAGGPIVQDGVVLGIYMFSQRCAKNPSVYINLSNFTEWINETINAE